MNRTGKKILDKEQKFKRKIIAVNMVSLDGFYEGPNDMMDLPFDHAFGAYNLERLKTATTVLLGHTSYRMFGGFWPQVEKDPGFSEVDREFSKRYNKVEKVVVSYGTVNAVPAWSTTTRIISNDVYDSIRKLKQDNGKDIVMWGSHILWNNLLAHRLLDEIHFVVGNTALGSGRSAFMAPIQEYECVASLKLLDTFRAGPISDNIIIKYALKYNNTL